MPGTIRRGREQQAGQHQFLDPLALAPGVLNTTMPRWNIDRLDVVHAGTARPMAFTEGGKVMLCMSALRTRWRQD